MFANIAGGVHIGKYAYIGMSAAVRELVSVGERSVISMGEIISKDVPDFALAIGTPVKYMKINESFRVFKKAKDSSKH
jgi:acyl-[acyl carrier protein]--UDP-N-acetylglucosamine O-acyltransferase